MIPRDFITEWRGEAPWVQDAQVEQDLVIARALVVLFSDPLLSAALAFRGGTALYKLHIRPPARYSEDIDLVQVRAEPIGPVMDALRAVLDPWLGAPRRTQNEGRVTLLYRFASEDLPSVPLRLKVEINTREHLSVYGYRRTPFNVDSRWFAGAVDILGYDLDELMGTKLRALYQRRKGRDLFDLAVALQAGADPARVIPAFRTYMDHQGVGVTRALFEKNLAGKLKSPQFTADISPLLAPDYAWDLDAAATLVSERLIARLPGDPWKGEA